LNSAQVVLLILLIFLLLPATTLYGLESSWNWLDSFYYCFISLTTVSKLNISGKIRIPF
jgi:hypothetical protein